MSSWMSGVLGGGIVVLVFSAGFAIGHGQATAPASAPQPSLPSKIDVTLSGSTTERGGLVGCLDWVADHFEHATVGQLGMICSGAP